MSSGPLLTITESHGFRALMATIIAIIAAVHMLGRELRNLVLRKMRFGLPGIGLAFWAQIWQSRDAVAHRVPVLWFDTSGGREGPADFGRSPQTLLQFCEQPYSPARPVANQHAPADPGWGRFRT
jgi:hypothetical protein